MKRSVLIVLLLTLAVPCLALGQAQTAPPPKPGPELQRLGYFVGVWKYEAGTETSTMTCEWFAGRYSIVCREDGTTPTGKYSDHRVMTYDPTEKVYTHYMVTSIGPGGGLAKGTVSGNTWLWQWEAPESGKPARFRMTIVEVTPASYTVKVERSLADAPWTVVGEGKGTKVK